MTDGESVQANSWSVSSASWISFGVLLGEGAPESRARVDGFMRRVMGFTFSDFWPLVSVMDESHNGPLRTQTASATRSVNRPWTFRSLSR